MLVAAAAILLVAGLAPQGAVGRSLLEGTQRADALSGGAAAETIKGHDGDDRLAGGDGDDLLLGGGGRDRLKGGLGEDVLRGGPGDDVLRARDGRTDRLDCGRGEDVAIVDRLDPPVRHCEQVKRPPQPVKSKKKAFPAASLPGLPAPATPVAPAPDPSPETHLLAAGDIADCTPPAEATAKLLDARPGVVAVLGDAVYTAGTLEEYAQCYDPTWGRHKQRTRPVIGDHDYDTPDGAGFFGYWGSLGGEPGKGWYSYELGSWHVVALNSACARIGGCDAGSPQEQWLRADLAAHPALCTLAYWHSPRFSSGGLHRSDPVIQPLWQALYDNGVELVLSGNDHNYERFAPQGPKGELDTAAGVRQFVVGTGGRYLRPMGAIEPNSEVSDATTFGVLDLKLGPLGYDWTFVPVEGALFTDTGSGVCH
jgi:Ca2+-binding RTX toxin-like protein